MNKLIAIASILAIMAVSSGKLPQILYQVQLAKLYLIKDSQTSSWCQAVIFLPKK